MAIQLVTDEHAPGGKTAEAMIELGGKSEPIHAYFHKHEETGEVHVVVDEDDFDAAVSGPVTVTLNDGGDSKYVGTFDHEGKFTPVVTG